MITTRNQRLSLLALIMLLVVLSTPDVNAQQSGVDFPPLSAYCQTFTYTIPVNDGYGSMAPDYSSEGFANANVNPASSAELQFNEGSVVWVRIPQNSGLYRNGFNTWLQPGQWGKFDVLTGVNNFYTSSTVGGTVTYCDEYQSLPTTTPTPSITPTEQSIPVAQPTYTSAYCAIIPVPVSIYMLDEYRIRATTGSNVYFETAHYGYVQEQDIPYSYVPWYTFGVGEGGYTMKGSGFIEVCEADHFTTPSPTPITSPTTVNVTPSSTITPNPSGTPTPIRLFPTNTTIATVTHTVLSGSVTASTTSTPTEDTSAQTATSSAQTATSNAQTATSNAQTATSNAQTAISGCDTSTQVGSMACLQLTQIAILKTIAAVNTENPNGTPTSYTANYDATVAAMAPKNAAYSSSGETDRYEANGVTFLSYAAYWFPCLSIKWGNRTYGVCVKYYYIDNLNIGGIKFPLPIVLEAGVYLIIIAIFIRR